MDKRMEEMARLLGLSKGTVVGLLAEVGFGMVYNEAERLAAGRRWGGALRKTMTRKAAGGFEAPRIGFSARFSGWLLPKRPEAVSVEPRERRGFEVGFRVEDEPS